MRVSSWLCITTASLASCFEPDEPDEASQPMQEHRTVEELGEETGVPDVTKMLELPTLESAIAYTLPYVGDPYPPPGINDTWDDLGRFALGYWALKHLRWSDLEPLRADIRAAAVAKNPSRFLGQRACFSGEVTEWASHARALMRIHAIDDQGSLISAMVVGGCPECEVGVRLDVCGVIIGRFGRPELDPDAGVSIVGLVDSPSGRARVP